MSVEYPPEKFDCPECGREAGTCCAVLFLPHSTANLEVPYYVCVGCGTCGYVRSIVRRRTSQWRNDPDALRAKRVSYSFLLRTVYAHLDSILRDRVERMGNRIARFRRYRRSP